MTQREQIFALGGVVLGAAVAYGALRPSDPSCAPISEDGISTLRARDAGGSNDEDAGVAPAMIANQNLTQSLQECTRQAASLSLERLQLERELDQERMAEADASRSAQARRIARHDLSQEDWKPLASTGTIRYVLPCASFNPPSEMQDALGLAPADVATVQNAFAAARDTAWAQVRPLCATAVGNSSTADKLGLDTCPQVILAAERTANPSAADVAMHAVGAVRAGLADPSTVPSGDPVGTAFLAMTEVAKDAESRLGAVLGRDGARAVVYASGSCSRLSEFASAVPAPNP
jgi:hypothetical protein